MLRRVRGWDVAGAQRRTECNAPPVQFWNRFLIAFRRGRSGGPREKLRAGGVGARRSRRVQSGPRYFRSVDEITGRGGLKDALDD
ncbi:unnamed protein product, partial [Iphiclides podalirius]